MVRAHHITISSARLCNEPLGLVLSQRWFCLGLLPGPGPSELCATTPESRRLQESQVPEAVHQNWPKSSTHLQLWSLDTFVTTD